MVAGLLITSVPLLWQSRIEVDTGYGTSGPAFVLMGLGMGLVMSPMSMAAMNAVDRSKAGVASGTLSMFRMVGGTFGVAALGALVAGVGRHDLEQSLPGLPGDARERWSRASARRPGSRARPARLVDAAHAAFVDALVAGLTVAAAARRRRRARLAPDRAEPPRPRRPSSRSRPAEVAGRRSPRRPRASDARTGADPAAAARIAPMAVDISQVAQLDVEPGELPATRWPPG